MVDHSPGHLSWLSKSWRIGTIFGRPGQSARQLHSLSQPCPPTKEAAFTKQAEELKLGSADFCSQISKGLCEATITEVSTQGHASRLVSAAIVLSVGFQKAVPKE